MRILLDLRCLETASALRGIGRYTRELARSLRSLVPADSCVAGLSWSGLATELGLEDLVCPPPRRGIGFTDRFTLPGLLRRHRVDLYHATAYALPAGKLPGVARVLTIHDLVADLYPAALSLRHRLALRRTFRSARSADRVVTVSEVTRRDLLARYALDPRRVVAVPNGVSDAFAPGREEAPGSGFVKPFLLYVGGLDPLKNVPFLLEVLQRVQRRCPQVQLVVAGEDGARRHALLRRARALALGDHVHAVGHLEEARLRAAYREASVFVFPSRYEGFGLPPLEAMAAGCAVVSSPAGALAEVLGDAARLCDPDDADGWARALVALLEDPVARQAASAAGRRQAARFTWEESARRTLAVYQEALSERDRA